MIRREKTYYVMGLSKVTDKIQLINTFLEKNPTTYVYLKTFDPEAYNGRGEITTTKELNEAKRFENFQAVIDEWNTQSKIRPLRPDGKPNKPLTAFTVEPRAVISIPYDDSKT